MSDTEAREETPPVYEDSMPRNSLIYINIKGIILNSHSNCNECWYKELIFNRIYKVNTDPSNTRNLSLSDLINHKPEICEMTNNEYRNLKNISLPKIEGTEADVMGEGLDNYEDIIIITHYSSMEVSTEE